MRTRTILTLAVGAIALMLTLPAQRAQAMPLSGIAQATEGLGVVEDAAYVCRRYWRHGRSYRHCYWVGPHRYYPPRHRRWHRRW